MEKIILFHLARMDRDLEFQAVGDAAPVRVATHITDAEVHRILERRSVH